jgi:hypothetical protein
MTEQEASLIGQRAAMVLENTAYQSAIEAMRAQVVQQWKDCPIRDKEGQLLLLQLAKLTDKFEGILRGYVEGGKLAQHKIDMDSLRDESGARKLMRRVL